MRVFDTRARVRGDGAGRRGGGLHRPHRSAWSRRSTRATSLVTIGGDADWIARYLASLPLRLEVLDPPEVLEELRLLAEQLLEMVRTSRAPDGGAA